MKEYIIHFKRYEADPSDENLEKFLSYAFHEYTKKVVGYDMCLEHVGIHSLKDFDNWIKNDLYFKEWFKNEFNYWLKFNDDGDLELIDLRWTDAPKSLEEKKLYTPKFAEPRDIDELYKEALE